MSSDEEDNDPETGLTSAQKSKRRRIQRACDMCRRKKIRCDGVQMPTSRCTNCVIYGHDCTYVEAAKKRGPPKSYIEGLENRVEKLQDLLYKISPEALQALNESMDVLEKPPSTSSITLSFPAPEPRDMTPTFIRHVGNTSAPVNDDPESAFLADNLHNLSLGPGDNRFFGKSSGAMLIKTALELKREYMGTERNPPVTEFPHLRPWTTSSSGQFIHPQYSFPEEDLMHSLIDLYFTHMNLYLPLLHRPTFERSVKEGLHHTHDMFGVILLLVCAVAARYSDDPRVLLDGISSQHSCGWKWFSQVPMIKKTPLVSSSLFELQFYALLGQFLQASSVPQACWTVVGIGIRIAQDVGAHRRKSCVLTVEDELWKRAFWVLVCMDRLFSSSLGRPCSIQDEDFDIDMPLECDDEYWENPDPQQCFKQPPAKPSVIVYFNVYIKLNQILAFLLRTIYAINKSKILLGFVGPEWEESIVSELDSALNKWVDALPDHLRWDPKRESKVFFNQSASLYAAYYHTQILVHRPFIPSPQKQASLSFPSLAICTNAARSCSHLLDIQRRRYSIAPPPLQTSAFSAGVVLLLNIWGGKRSGLSTDSHKEMEDVQKCIEVLKSSESRWFLAGRLRDILHELASVGELRLPQNLSPITKREREEYEPFSSHDVEEVYTVFPGMGKHIAGRKHVAKEKIVAAPHALASDDVAAPVRLPGYNDQRQQTSHSPPDIYSPTGYQDTQRGSKDRSHPISGQHIHTRYWYGSADTGTMQSSMGQGSMPPRHAHASAISDQYYPSVDNMSTMSVFPVLDSASSHYSSGSSYEPSPLVRRPPSAASLFQPLPADTSTSRVNHEIPLAQQQTLDGTYAMWSDAPAGFELDEWGNYLSNINLTHSHGGTPGGRFPPGGGRGSGI